MQISILILTHKRPKLFERCIHSVLKNKPKDAEILVNNDTKDIIEIPGATYFYENNYDLSVIYNMLINKAKGKYIFFLEDDDYVVPNFWELVYSSMCDKTLFFNYIPHNGMLEYFKRFKNKIKNTTYSKDYFFKICSEEHFQLSQIIFRKEDVTTLMKGNFLDNDFKFFKKINNDILYNEKPIFIQTIDAKDNISFLKYNTDLRFEGQH